MAPRKDRTPPPARPRGAAPGRRPPAAGDLSARIREERYRVLIEGVADGFYEVDLKGDFRFVNDALCRIFGRPREAVLGLNYRDLMDEENARRAFEAFNRLYREGGGSAGIAWEIRRADGSPRFLEISAKLIADAEGRPAGFRGIARDVTDRHRAQRALEESQQCALDLSAASRRAEQRYRAFLNFLPIPVFVFNLDSTVSYLNPAFEEVFGWSFAELEGKIIPFIPPALKEETREGIRRLFREKILRNFDTKRLTRDGRLLDILIDGAVFYDEEDKPAGQVVTLRDVTREKRSARINQALFRIAKALHQFRSLDARLEVVTREIRELLNAEGAMVILLDHQTGEFFFREAAFGDSETGHRIKEVRFPADKGIAGEVYRTGKPVVVHDTAQCPFFLPDVDEKTSFRTLNVVEVPLETTARMIGVLCAVNKREGRFDEADVELLRAIAGIVAFPIENAEINEALERSIREVNNLNRAKDRVIHHLSHELRTPLAVLSASLNLLAKQLARLGDDRAWRGAIERAERNLLRLLDLQYKIEDMLKEKDVDTRRLLSVLLDQCTDELEALAAEEFGEETITERLRRRIDWIFGPREVKAERIHLMRFTAEYLKLLRPKFAHRGCRLALDLNPTEPIVVPAEVLGKVIEGLVKNAVENTPDGGVVTVSVRRGNSGPELEVRDTGTGITEETQRLIRDNYFTAYEPLHYATRSPYDFKAGGKGFDLLRMQIFAERHRFKIRLHSERCRWIPAETDPCPGADAECPHLTAPEGCLSSGGTTVTVSFPAAPEGPPAEAPGERAAPEAAGEPP
jgi:PAS domain S-box-containing protein